jgi:OOP family OmpA-OmpF porin
MKLPFRSRSPVDDDAYDYEYGYDDEPDDLGSIRLGRPSYADGGDGRRPPPPAARAPREPRILPATTDSTPIVGADDFADQLERLRSEANAEQRTAWAYLVLLGGLFSFIVLFGYACSPDRGAVPSGGPVDEAVAGGEPSRLVFRIDGDIVAVEGTVPDEAARAQLLAIAEAAYGAPNVLDELAVDEATTLDGGTVRFIGTAVFGDERPESLQQTVSSDFGLDNRGFEVAFVDELLNPVNAEVAVQGNGVVLAGQLPDEGSIGDLVSIATEVWGEGNVDASSLTVGSTTWTEGRLRVSGTAAADQRIAQFVGLVSERLGPLIAVDTTALSVADGPELLATVQSTINGLVTNDPIQFAPNSPEIEAVSDAVLVDIASSLGSLATTPVEVVGHTDAVGDEDENLVLSEQRAQAVVDRLVELGIAADRLSARGEGEAQPIADNDTDEGRAANRRIEFVIAGAPADSADGG